MKQQINEEMAGRISVLILALLLLFLRFPDFFQTPNTKVIEPYADGIKAYTVIQYHARYDSTLSYYQGMNYPYSEHVVPAATQPLLSNTIKLISKIVDITPYTIGIVNCSLLLGLILCAFFLYLIFRELETPVWWAVGVALGLTFLTPQLHRMISHYGLAHPEVLPVILYLLMRLEKQRSWKISAWIAVAVTAFSLIHFYYFAIITFTISFYFLFGFLRKPGWQKLLRYALHYIIQLIIPLIFFYFWMYHQDTVTDRTAHPWGFFYFKAIWEGIFTALSQPHFQWIDSQIIKIDPTQYEGRAYVGLMASLGILLLLVRWAVSKFQQPFIRSGGALNGFLHKILLVGIVLLLFSFCWPFSWPGWQWLADYAGPIRQFRSVGRFSWVFFYAVNIIVFAELWHTLSSKQWKWALLIPALALLYFEAYHHAHEYDLRLDEIKELNEGSQYTDLEGVDYDEYQAILTIPYYNVGSDNFWKDGGGDIVPRSQILSVQTGLPTTSAMLTRTSLSQTMKQLELIYEPYRLPVILEEFPSDKPLLLLVSNYHFNQQRPLYEHLLEESQLIYENDQFQLYRVALSAFQRRIDSKIRNIEYTIENDTLELRKHGDFLSRDNNRSFYYDSYDKAIADSTYRGAGAYQGIAREENIIFERTIPQQQAGGYYSLSFWMYLAQDMAPRSWVTIREKEKDSGNILNQEGIQVHSKIKVLDNGWGLFETTYITKSSNSTIQLSIKNQELKETPLYIDEFLARPQLSDIYKAGATYLYKNNRWFPKQ